MNSLSSTRVFDLMDKAFSLKKTLSSQEIIDKYTVDKEFYSNYIQNIKAFKFPLVKQIVDALNNDLIKPVLFADPKNEKEISNSKQVRFPSSITGFLLPNRQGKITGYSDISARGKYRRNNYTKEIELLVLDDREFINFMQNAYITYILYKYDNALSNNYKFIKCIADAYSYILGRTISAIYPVSANLADAEIMNYMIKVFCLQNFFGFSLENAKDTVFNFNTTNKQLISNNCNYYVYFDSYSNNKDEYIDMSKPNEDKTLYPIDVFVNLLSNEFTYIKRGKMKYRNIMNRFVSMYGQNSITTIEHCGSFINMMLSSYTYKIDMYSDNMIERNLGSFAVETYKILSMMTL